MISVRRSEDRGHANHGWLDSQHTFSFAGYLDPQHMGFRSLRVMNEDRVAPGKGLGTHAREDMGIVSYVLEGQLEHKDSMGNGEVLRRGEFQRLTAGAGITHSEFNRAADLSTHFYQIWLLLERKGIEPGCEQRTLERHGRKNQLQLVASRRDEEDSMMIHQDANTYPLDLDVGRKLNFGVSKNRHIWLQVLRGTVQAGAYSLRKSDAIATSNETDLQITSSPDVELMLFDLA